MSSDKMYNDEIHFTPVIEAKDFLEKSDNELSHQKVDEIVGLTKDSTFHSSFFMDEVLKYFHDSSDMYKTTILLTLDELEPFIDYLVHVTENYKESFISTDRIRYLALLNRFCEVTGESIDNFLDEEDDIDGNKLIVKELIKARDVLARLYHEFPFDEFKLAMHCTRCYLYSE